MVNASITAGGILLAGPLRAVARVGDAGTLATDATARRLDGGWEFYRGILEGGEAAWSRASAAAWEPTQLPHCFNALNECDPDTPYFRGQGWYRARIEVANPFEGGRTVLNFQGAGQTSSLWVGAVFVGKHKGGYDEFSFDITEAIARLQHSERQGGIPVVVCCDNTPDVDRVPSELSDFCLYGGLYRHVNLAYLPPVSLNAVHIEPVLDADGAARVTVSARLYNPAKHSARCTLTTEIVDPHGRMIHSTSVRLSTWEGYENVAEIAVDAPELWSPETPKLYRCRAVLSTPEGESELEERFGFRTAEFVEHGPFKLNGKRLLLRGTHRHADHAGVAAAMSDEQVRREMKMIREMGANFIRLAHYQQDRLVLDLCDELGLLVWEEVPWCRAGVGSERMQQSAKDMLTHMIDQHYNHPSILLWGLGNEDDWPGEDGGVNKPAIRAFMTEMRDLAHELDHTRLTAFRRCDFARDIPDVYSPSIWAGWYRGNYREYEKSLRREHERVKHFLHMEWGADSQAGRHAENPDAVLGRIPMGDGTDERGLDYLDFGGGPRVSRDGDWSETYACNLFDWFLKTQEKLDWLTGSAQWIFKDFASPLRSENGIPRINQKGVVERDLRKKESYYVFQSYWSEKPMVHIYGHTWPLRWGSEDEARPVHVYSNCETVELFLNGQSLGAKQRNSEDFPAAGLRWNVRFNKGENRLQARATKGAAKIDDAITLHYQTEKWGKPAKILLAQKARAENVVTVEATLVDARGVQCLDAATWVRFSIEGAGRLIDNMGTTRASRQIQLSNGKAEISFDRSGPCKIGVKPEGVPGEFLEL